MSFAPMQAPAMIMLGAAFASSPVRAEAPERGPNQRAVITAPAEEGCRRTGKERLGEKWQDKQRIDNCKVPLEERGTKPRPDSCAH